MGIMALAEREPRADTYEPIFRDAYDRLLSKELNAVSRAMGKDGAVKKLEDFYLKHESHARTVLRPAVEGYLRQVGAEEELDEVTSGLVSVYINDSQGSLLRCIEEAKDVDTWVENSRAGRPRALAEQSVDILGRKYEH